MQFTSSDAYELSFSIPRGNLGYIFEYHRNIANKIAHLSSFIRLAMQADIIQETNLFQWYDNEVTGDDR